MDLPCKRSDLLFIRWCDAVCDSECAQIEEARKAQLAVNVNVGWILHENADRLVLAHGLSSTGEIDFYVIPVANILERLPVIGSRKAG